MKFSTANHLHNTMQQPYPEHLELLLIYAPKAASRNFGGSVLFAKITSFAAVLT